MAVSILEADEPELLGWAALANLEAMIDDHPHFDAFVALDFMAGAASILVWKAMGPSRYALTFGLMPEISEAIVNGQITLAVSLDEERWGDLIVRQLLKAGRHEKIPAFIDTGISLVGAAAGE